MDIVADIARQPVVQATLAGFHDRLEEALELIVAIQQIPAPSFAESRRAEFVRQQFEQAGLCLVSQDKLHNVLGCLPSDPTQVIQRPPVVVSAHLDTVFAEQVDLSVRRQEKLIFGPGIGDNATGVAGLLLLAQAIRTLDVPLASDLWFVANVCEEGLGDLRGMRTVVKRFGRQATYIVVEGGLYGQLSHQAIGVRRFQIEVKAPGGHSWGSFGTTSAIHVLGHLIVAIDRLSVPETPKTTYNVGVIEGGTTVNSIADSASMLIDLRSEAPARLEALVKQVQAIVRKFNRDSTLGWNGVEITMTPVGNRPAGSIPRHAPLVAWAESALRQVGCGEIRYIASSTDANVPLSLGGNALCLGLTESGNAHRLDEYIDSTHLPDGLGQLLLVTLAAATNSGEWAMSTSRVESGEQ
jgi:acetylornithine deacetylase/succinyl-diaminopimelate desuccinylase-like protein